MKAEATGPGVSHPALPKPKSFSGPCSSASKQPFAWTRGPASPTTVFKSRAVYFHGQAGDGEGPNDHYYPSLADWLRKSRRAHMVNQLLQFRWAVYATGTWLHLRLVALFSPVNDDVQQIIRYELIGVAEYVGREALFFVVEILITIIALATAAMKIMLFLAYALRNALGRLLGFRPG
ncbi:hypothetical protein N657DRAFT_677041 [Parathielavia appendiculata]|uniref:Uncharacterized protein n=1 Tax=Parathielavia appendiculata TaxID=2587402 RepID=A0AAN6UAE8_9PEZI|nr:hypothetical protein N657DRAFT_677041 [Parathielavia appendiculata]